MKLLLSLIIVALIILFAWYFFGPPYPVEPNIFVPIKEDPMFPDIEPVSQPYEYESGGKG